jgi:two-component system, cell cycle response regulator DivK
MNERKRILVVDDEAMMRDIVTSFLESEGYEVESASAGDEALQAIRRHPPHLAVLDLCMPGMTGWELIAQLKGMPDAPGVVVMSGMGMDEPPELGAIGAQVLGYLPKPFSGEQLLRTCAHALAAAGASRALPPAGAERRAAPRKALVVPAALLAQDGTPAAMLQILDLGKEGALLDLGAALEPGLILQVAFDIPGQGSFRISGQVVWNKDGRLGLKFTHLDEADRARLDQLLGS